MYRIIQEPFPECYRVIAGVWDAFGSGVALTVNSTSKDFQGTHRHMARYNTLLMTLFWCVYGLDLSPEKLPIICPISVPKSGDMGLCKRLGVASKGFGWGG